jgi:hypothetical protein
VLAADEPKAKRDPETSSLDAWLCANVSPLFCPGFPDFRVHQPATKRPPQTPKSAQSSPKDSTTKGR